MIHFLKKVLPVAIFMMATVAFAQKKTKIDILQAKTLEGTGQQNVTKLKGDCIFKQDNILLYCDSALLYEQTNSVGCVRARTYGAGGYGKFVW